MGVEGFFTVSTCATRRSGLQWMPHGQVTRRLRLGCADAGERASVRAYLQDAQGERDGQVTMPYRICIRKGPSKHAVSILAPLVAGN